MIHDFPRRAASPRSQDLAGARIVLAEGFPAIQLPNGRRSYLDEVAARDLQVVIDAYRRARRARDFPHSGS